MLMLKDLPPFVSGEFKYRIVNDRTVRVSCGDNFDICIPMDDLDRGVTAYAKAKAQWAVDQLHRGEVVPIKGRKR
jgi:hypothetical protein